MGVSLLELRYNLILEEVKKPCNGYEKDEVGMVQTREKIRGNRKFPSSCRNEETVKHPRG